MSVRIICGLENNICLYIRFTNYSKSKAPNYYYYDITNLKEYNIEEIDSVIEYIKEHMSSKITICASPADISSDDIKEYIFLIISVHNQYKDLL